MRIVGVDPGRTTGLCVFTKKGFSYGEEALEYRDIQRFIRKWNPNTVVMEDFRIRRGQPVDYHSPIRVMGVVECLCIEEEIGLVIQSPSILSMALPRVNGIHPSPHVRSACAHVVYYLHKNDKGGKTREIGENAPKVRLSPRRVKAI
jgi:hypothetical protein